MSRNIAPENSRRADADAPRFNNLIPGETLDWFAWFEVLPVRRDRRLNGGDAFLAAVVQDVPTAPEAVRVARQIAIETGCGILAGDTAHGFYRDATVCRPWWSSSPKSPKT